MKIVTAIPMRLDWDPVVNSRHVLIPPGAIKTSIPDLCRRAGIPVRATTDRAIYIYRGRKKVRTPIYDLVGVPIDPRTSVGALRALESLAYSFFDHFARYCVCKRGLFIAPSTSASVTRVRKGSLKESG
jgi:hypothetical protein